MSDEGQAEERKESIRILVTTYQELNQTKEMAVDALVKKEAKDFMYICRNIS